MTKTTHGGKRINAGRPKGEPTSTLSYRVKNKHKADIKAKIEDVLKDYK